MIQKFPALCPSCAMFLLCLIILSSLSLNVNCQEYDGILGDKTNYTTRYDMSGNSKFGVFGDSFEITSKYVQANITQITAKINNPSSWDFRFGIYELIDGYNASKLIAYTEIKNTYILAGNITANITYPANHVILDKGRYLFSVLCEGTIGVYGGTRVNYDEYHEVTDIWSDGFSDPFGSSGAIHNNDYSRCIYANFVDEYVYLSEQIDAILANTVPVLGASGLIMLMFSPFFFIKRKNKKGYLEAFIWTFVIAILGFGFVVVWLWG